MLILTPCLEHITRSVLMWLGRHVVKQGVRGMGRRTEFSHSCFFQELRVLRDGYHCHASKTVRDSRYHYVLSIEIWISVTDTRILEIELTLWKFKSFCVCVARAAWWGDGLISAPVSANITLIVSQWCNETSTLVVRCLQHENRVGFLTLIWLTKWLCDRPPSYLENGTSCHVDTYTLSRAYYKECCDVVGLACRHTGGPWHGSAYGIFP